MPPSSVNSASAASIPTRLAGMSRPPNRLRAASTPTSDCSAVVRPPAVSSTTTDPSTGRPYGCGGPALSRTTTRLSVLVLPSSRSMLNPFSVAAVGRPPDRPTRISPLLPVHVAFGLEVDALLPHGLLDGLGLGNR